MSLQNFEEKCGEIGGEFNANRSMTRMSCKVDGSKIVAKRSGENRAGIKLEQEKNNTTVKGRIQGDIDEIAVKADPEFVADQKILQVQNLQGESVEIITD